MKIRTIRRVDSWVELYESYLAMYNSQLNDSIKLAPQELKIMAYVLAQKIHISQFKKVPYIVLQKHFNIKKSTAETHRRRLLSKGWINKEGLPNNNLVRLQKAIKESSDSTLEVIVKLQLDVDTP